MHPAGTIQTRVRLARTGVAVLIAIAALSYLREPIAQAAEPVPSGAGAVTLDADEQRMLHLVNAYRRGFGLRDLELSTSLQRAAEWKADALAAGGVAAVGHDDIDRTWMERLVDLGYPPELIAGENIGLGPRLVIEMLLDAWRASPIHDQNLRGETWRYIGIAHAAGPDGMQYWVLTFGEAAGDPNAVGP